MTRWHNSMRMGSTVNLGCPVEPFLTPDSRRPHLVLHYMLCMDIPIRCLCLLALVHTCSMVAASPKA